MTACVSSFSATSAVKKSGLSRPGRRALRCAGRRLAVVANDAESDVVAFEVGRQRIAIAVSQRQWVVPPAPAAG